MPHARGTVLVYGPRKVSAWRGARSVGSQGDAFDDALAESVIGLYKTQVIRRRRPWRTLETVEFATPEWAD